MSATYVSETTQNLEPFQGVKKVPYAEYFTSGHRTCEGCESAQLMRLMAKAAGPRTIILGATGCMYVANTSYYSTVWGVPWMHTQLGSGGSSALGTAAALRVLMRKGVIQDEAINVIAFCGDGGGADMGLSAISATLTHPDYNLLILLYDNEEYANTDIQVSGTSPWGANTSFSTPGSLRRIMHHRWKKNVVPLMLAGHPGVKYLATISTSYPLQAMNSIRKALSVGGPTFIHCLNPCPKGWDFDPVIAFELGQLAVNTGIWPLYEIDCGRLRLYGKTEQIAKGRFKRLPARDYLLKQGRFAHFREEDIEFFQSKVDEMWDRWLVPGVIPLAKEFEAPGTRTA
jgi:pyruvate ferredoxin oxidoreductase beta subunit